MQHFSAANTWHHFANRLLVLLTSLHCQSLRESLLSGKLRVTVCSRWYAHTLLDLPEQLWWAVPVVPLTQDARVVVSRHRKDTADFSEDNAPP